jgi:hypothetical protein
MNHFIGRDYVTVRKEQHDRETVSVESSVGRTLLMGTVQPAMDDPLIANKRPIGRAMGK